MNLPKSPTFLGNFCKGAKIIHFSNEIIFGKLYRHLAIFIWSHWIEVAKCFSGIHGCLAGVVVTNPRPSFD